MNNKDLSNNLYKTMRKHLLMGFTPCNKGSRYEPKSNWPQGKHANLGTCTRTSPPLSAAVFQAQNPRTSRSGSH